MTHQNLRGNGYGKNIYQNCSSLLFNRGSIRDDDGDDSWFPFNISARSREFIRLGVDGHIWHHLFNLSVCLNDKIGQDSLLAAQHRSSNHDRRFPSRGHRNLNFHNKHPENVKEQHESKSKSRYKGIIQSGNCFCFGKREAVPFLVCSGCGEYARIRALFSESQTNQRKFQ